MKKNITVTLALLLVCVLGLSAAGCKEPTKNRELRLNEVTHSIFYAPLYAAIELGYFEEEGIDIVLTNGGGADATMTAVLSGSADVGFCGPEASIYVYNEGRDNYCVNFAQLTKRDGSFLFSRKNEPNFDWNSLNGKNIIAGRRGGVPSMTLEYVLNNCGLYDGDNVTLNHDVQFNLMGPAFESGTGDYVTLFEPTASEMQKAGKGYIVASVGEKSGEVPYTAFCATKKYVAENRDLLLAFIRALYKGVDYTVNKDEKTVAEKIMGQFPGSDVSSIAQAIKSYKSIDAWQLDLRMTESAFTRLQDIITNAGELSRRAPYSALVDNSLIDEIKNK